MKKGVDKPVNFSNFKGTSKMDSDYEMDSPGVNDTRVLREKVELMDRIAQNINLDKYDGKGHRTTRDKSERATVEQVLDPRTMGFLAKLFKNGTITAIDGCISTGKEANVYHAENANTGKEFAVKIYKTSILVFKDRERYVDGEFRFRNNKNQSNPRKMVRTWAEKEFRNLKRLHASEIPSPEPIDLKSHVLVMEFLSRGEGAPSPKLKDYQFKDLDEVVEYYTRLLVDMRLLYQKCHLIHADLSEYNTIVHQDDLYIFDVSQSVEPDHPMALDFLRMDIKNVNDYFDRAKKINVYPERLIFRFIIDPWESIDPSGSSNPEDVQVMREYLNGLPLKVGEDQIHQDEIFRSLHLVTSLHHLEERDFERFNEGHIDTLRDLVDMKEGDKDVDVDEDDEDEGEDEGEDEDEDENENETKSDDESNDPTSRLKRYEDKDAKKARKKAAKEAAREKRKTKMNKNVKKRLVKKSSNKH